MGEEGLADGGRGWLVALLWPLLLLPTGVQGSWPAASSSAAPAAVAAATEEPGWRLAPGAACGRPKVMGKIYGGQDVPAGHWPWQASLLYHRSHICGAVLIDSLWLLSTAHCFLNKSAAPAHYRVVLGSTELYQRCPHAQEAPLSRIVVHPDFEKHHPFGSDIAMLQLRARVHFTTRVAPACLPGPGVQLSGDLACWISGWGMLSEDRLPPRIWALLVPLGHRGSWGAGAEGGVHVLMDADLRLSSGSIGSTLECISKATHGDSGGPLVCDLGAWVLVGLASWGLDCRHPIYPSVFTRVGYFTDWIDKIQRLTPPPDPTTAPQTLFPDQPRQAAGSSKHSTVLVSPQTWFLLLLVLRDLQQALW
ncbi:putative serine protease 47 [Suricata suricatta]|uniref:putative serine protease 47 n=1 Tax=Suricata suricatta TaxID=37032 RepID=UPI00115575CF|nr:putative serine protease 47 [Suricata suricatta]